MRVVLISHRQPSEMAESQWSSVFRTYRLSHSHDVFFCGTTVNNARSSGRFSTFADAIRFPRASAHELISLCAAFKIKRVEHPADPPKAKDGPMKTTNSYLMALL